MIERRQFLAMLAGLGASSLMRVQAAINGDPLQQLWLAPWTVMPTPDAWQKQALAQLITQQENAILCCSRGAGKTETVSAAAYVEACLGGFCMVLSRSDRQAMRVFSRVQSYASKFNFAPIVRNTMHEMTFANGGRVVALPCREDTIRGEHGVSLLIIDEASRVPDQFFGAVTPMVAISKGRIVLLSTPFGKRGFFYKEWTGEGSTKWCRHKYTWEQCPRLDEAFIAEERRRHGEEWVAQEYECKFLDTVNAVFNIDQLIACIDQRLEVQW